MEARTGSGLSYARVSGRLYIYIYIYIYISPTIYVSTIHNNQLLFSCMVFETHTYSVCFKLTVER